MPENESTGSIGEKEERKNALMRRIKSPWYQGEKDTDPAF
jgi:hypothetical protein